MQKKILILLLFLPMLLGAQQRELGSQHTTKTTIPPQKKIVIQSFPLRFLREGDHTSFSARIANLSDRELSGQASLELIDPVTHASVDGWFENVFPVQYFTAVAGKGTLVNFPIQIPFGYNRPLAWRIKATTQDNGSSDSEQNIVAILPTRMMVTETLPFIIRNDSARQFEFTHLFRDSSETLTHESLTVEYTANPFWMAVLALPSLMEYPYECADQVFNRLFANALAVHIISTHPELGETFNEWRKDSMHTQSNTGVNELKQIILQETPWVLEAGNETEQRAQLAKRFDPNAITTAINESINTLQQFQLPSGGLSWFRGGPADRHITNYVMTGIGRLAHANELPAEISFSGNMLAYLDDQLSADYQKLLAGKADMEQQHLDNAAIEYLYMRSFFPEKKITDSVAYHYFYQQATRFWTGQNLYNRAVLGIVFLRNGDAHLAAEKVLPSILNEAIVDRDHHMYWKKSYTQSWYESPVEFQCMMTSFGAELNHVFRRDAPDRIIADMDKFSPWPWPFPNKKVNNWGTPASTADVCYLMLPTRGLTERGGEATIRLGATTFHTGDEPTVAATGYFKKRIEGSKVLPEMGHISVIPTASTAPNPVAYGNVYWQYFENINRIDSTSINVPLSVRKELYISRNTKKGKTLVPVVNAGDLKVGDLLVTRLWITATRDVDYTSVKDAHPATAEPVDMSSGYHQQGGIGYYGETSDASTQYFIDHLVKGTYRLEYSSRITRKGTFSAGLATIQCMYAPQFTGHSEETSIVVE